jgi:hypothetical protein
MNNKKLGLFLVLFALGYFIFITTVVGHGIMPANLFGSGVIMLLGVYYLVKKEE